MPWMKLKEAVEITGISYSKLYRLIRENKIVAKRFWDTTGFWMVLIKANKFVKVNNNNKKEIK